MHNFLFPSQSENEKILLVAREHWFRLFARLFIIGVFALLPTGILYLLGTTGMGDDKAKQVISLLTQLYYLGVFIAIYITLALYYLNVHIISEQRIVDIDQIGLLNHRISELNMETVQDVSSQTVGLFGSIFDYGTVFIQTAGASERFQFENIPQPAHVAKTILSAYEEHQKNNTTKKA